MMCVVLLGSASQKGTVMGILRSLGALARAMGPVVASSGKLESLLECMLFQIFNKFKCCFGVTGLY